MSGVLGLPWDVINEIEANEFAAHLTMPDDLVRAYLAKHPAVADGDDAAFVRMAHDFQAPLIWLGVRLADLRRHP